MCSWNRRHIYVVSVGMYVSINWKMLKKILILILHQASLSHKVSKEREPDQTHDDDDKDRKRWGKTKGAARLLLELLL